MNQQELLNVVARGILQLTGLSPENIQMQVNQRALQNQQIPKTPSIPKPKTGGSSTSSNTKPTTSTKSSGTRNPVSQVRNQIYARGGDRAINNLRTRINSSPTVTNNLKLNRLGGVTAGVGLVKSLLGLTPGPVGRTIRAGDQKFEEDRQFVEQTSIQQGQQALGSLAVLLGLVDPPTTNKSNTKKATNNKPTAQPLPPYSGMADMSGDPIKPTRSNNNRGGGTASSANTSGGTATPIPIQYAYDEGAPAPSAPARPDYSNMTELERLKIWATTNRKMIESVGTSAQRGILKQALGIKQPAPLTGRQI